MKKLALATTLAVGLALAGCSESQFLDAANKAAKLNSDFVDAVIDAHKAGFVDDASEDALLKDSRLVAVYDDQAVDALVSIHDKAGAVAKLDASIAALDDANQKQLLGIKNDSKRQEISAVLVALRGLLTTAKAALGGAK